MLFCSTGADGRGERGEDGLHEDGAHIRVRSVSSVEPTASCNLNRANDRWCPSVPSTRRHPSRLQDNMMPMSPDDYRALAQYVSPRDLAVVVSVQLCSLLLLLLLLAPSWRWMFGEHCVCVPVFLPRHLQGDNLICGFEEIAAEVDAALARCMKLSSSSFFFFLFWFVFCGSLFVSLCNKITLVPPFCHMPTFTGPEPRGCCML